MGRIGLRSGEETSYTEEKTWLVRSERRTGFARDSNCLSSLAAMRPRTVGLAGYGERLTTIARLLERSGVEGMSWRPDSAPADDTFDEDVSLEAVERDELREAALVILAVPIHEMRSVARSIGDVISGRHVLVHLGRTLERDTLDPISSILEDETPTRRFGCVTGPMATDDVLEGRSASALCASSFPEVIELVEDALTSEHFHVYHTNDLVGTEVAAAYTRILAVIDGIASAQSYGRSMRSTLFARGLAETSRIVEDAGGQPETAFGLAGAGNLRVDTTGTSSLDFRMGYEWARRGSEPDGLRDELEADESEWLTFLESLASRAPIDRLDLHFLDTLARFLFGDEGLAWTLDRLGHLPDRCR